jgi:hypothetical protein
VQDVDGIDVGGAVEIGAVLGDVGAWRLLAARRGMMADRMDYGRDLAAGIMDYGRGLTAGIMDYGRGCD